MQDLSSCPVAAHLPNKISLWSQFHVCTGPRNSVHTLGTLNRVVLGTTGMVRIVGLEVMGELRVHRGDRRTKAR